MNIYKIIYIVLIIISVVGLILFIKNDDKTGLYMVLGSLVLSIITQIVEKKYK